MSVLDELIFRRRSVRAYRPEMPSEEWIMAMMKCAAKAPSPTNSRPVRFIRIKSPEVRRSLYEAMRKGYQELLESARTCEKPRRKTNVINAYWRYSEFMNDAPLLFAVGTVKEFTGFSKRLFEAGIIDRDARTGTDLDISIGLAVKGFLLKGEELGLGMCVLTAPLVFIDGIEKIMGIEDMDIKCLITAGFPDEDPPSIERQNPSDMYREI